jgi:hypothetical protein
MPFLSRATLPRETMPFLSRATLPRLYLFP